MNPANLIKMANQIGVFFEAMPNREQAIKDIAAHIQKKLGSRACAQRSQNHVSNCSDAKLSPIVREALLLVQQAN